MGNSNLMDHDRYPNQSHSKLGTMRTLVLGKYNYLGTIVRSDLPPREMVGSSKEILADTGGFAEFEKSSAQKVYSNGYDVIYRIKNQDRYVSMRVQELYPDHNQMKRRLPTNLVGKTAELMFFYQGPRIKAKVVEDCGPLTLFKVLEGPHAGKYVTGTECQYSVSAATITIPRYIAEVRSYTATATKSDMWEVGSGYGKRKVPVSIEGPVVMDTVKRKRVATASSIERAQQIAQLFNSMENLK